MEFIMKRRILQYMLLTALGSMSGPGSSNLSALSGRSNPARAAIPEVVRYTVNTDKSTFIVRANRGGLFGFAGHNHTIAIRGFTGEVTATLGTIEPASLQIRIMADSLVVIDNEDEQDRRKIERDMREKVLETQKYPEIVFKSTKVAAVKREENEYEIKIVGNLTLHGVTRPVEIEAEMIPNDKSLNAKGKFSIKQKDYGIKPVSVAAGTVKVKNELQFSFDIIAEQQ